MRRVEVEHWTITVADRVKAGEPLEDSRVELKTEWPEAVDAARRRVLTERHSKRRLSTGVLQLKVEQHWDPIRSDPRFAALVKKVGIP